MQEQYPREIQSCIMYDGNVVPNLLALSIGFCTQLSLLHSVVAQPVPHQCSENFVLIMGQNDLHITIEYIPAPANRDVMKSAMNSSFVRIGLPDVETLVDAQKSHILINVRHGVMPKMDVLTDLMQQLDMPEQGADLESFMVRLNACALLTKEFCKLDPLLIHWGQSDKLIKPEFYLAQTEMPMPCTLNVHPFLYGQSQNSDGSFNMGLRTFGIKHFIGREVIVLPSPVPWLEVWLNCLVFLNVATSPNGYIIPHGDTFGDEDGIMSMSVSHIEANTQAAESADPHYQLRVIKNTKHNYFANDYVDAPYDQYSPELMEQKYGLNSDEDSKTLSGLNEAKAAADNAGIGYRIRPTPDANPAMPTALDADGSGEQVALNPDDPIDRAILRRLEERKNEKSEQGDKVSTPASTPGFGRRKAFGKR